ncbi:MAG: transcriptional repressor [Spirochaetes bacterium]|nr:transcriptional repressor [Spirochaetota bacterium]
MRPRLSEFREGIINLLDDRGVPLSVKEIHSENNNFDLSTVYRALEYLESSGKIKSISFPCHCGQMRYYHTGKKHVHYLHCEECHSFFAVPYCGLNKIEKDINANFHFNVTRHILFFLGICKNCSRKK